MTGTLGDMDSGLTRGKINRKALHRDFDGRPPNRGGRLLGGHLRGVQFGVFRLRGNAEREIHGIVVSALWSQVPNSPLSIDGVVLGGPDFNFRRALLIANWGRDFLNKKYSVLFTINVCLVSPCRRGSRILKWGVNFCNNVIEPKPG